MRFMQENQVKRTFLDRWLFIILIVCLIIGQSFFICFFSSFNRIGFAQSLSLGDEKRVLPERRGTLWAPFLEWSIENDSFSGNPFDILAEVIFVHLESGEKRCTEIFYAGGTTWKFRFSGTRLGKWTFTTSSKDRDLDGITGRLVIYPNPNPEVKGFLVSDGSKFARQVGENGELEGVLFNVWQGGDFPNGVNVWYNNSNIGSVIEYAIDNYIRAHGMTVLYSGAISNRWFDLETRSWAEHDAENPDPRTFEALEEAIVHLHSHGVHLHIWAWGDEQRKWTPIGVGTINVLPDRRPFRRLQRYLNSRFGKGGINGVPDKRLQRYIAARLGPLPGWSMSYGFDLEEWVTEDQVGEWAGYLKEHMGWPHLLMARGRTHPNLDVRSISNYGGPDTIPKDYADVVDDMNFDKSRPHLYEERFLHTRWDYFSMEVTRRHMWWYAMAGGIGGFWGILWDDGIDYPDSEQMLTHKQFWDERFLLRMERVNDLTNGLALKTSDNNHFIFYKEDASSIRMDLPIMNRMQPAVAVDTKKTYEEIDIGHLEAKKQVWDAPYVSDWAIAVGNFDDS